MLQAESVLDIIKSETDAELETAVNQLKGILSQKLNRIKENIKDALVDVETQIDFSDEDIFVEKRSFKKIKKYKKGPRCNN